MTESKASILERLLNEIPDEWDKSEGSYIYDAEAPIALELLNFYDLLENRKSQMSINTASGTYLENRLKEFGFYRKQATAASGYVTISGNEGVNIPINTLVASNNAVYEITDTAAIGSEGTVILPVMCTVTGVGGNAAIGEINRFPITVPGLTSVINTAPVTGGSSVETDSKLKDRFFEYMKKPSVPGNKAYYEKLALEVDGVGGALCIPLWNGAGTAKVVITDTSMQSANKTLTDNVQAHINDNRFIGAEITVAAAETVTVNISCKLSLTKSASSTDVYSNICASLKNYFKDISFPETSGTYITYAKVLTLIMSADGVNDCSGLKINNQTANIAIPAANVVVLGVASIE